MAQVINTNLKSVFWMCKYCIPYMLKQNQDKGSQSSIINNASIQAISSQPHVPGISWGNQLVWDEPFMP